MIKFTFIVLLVALVVAVSSATITLISPTSTDPITLGASFDLVFETSDQLGQGDGQIFTLSANDVFIDVGLQGQGSGAIWCKTANGNAVYYTINYSSFHLVVTSTIPAGSSVTCPARFSPSLNPSQPITFTTDDTATELKLAALPADAKITAAVSGSSVAYTISGFPPNVVAGPLTFFYSWNVDGAPSFQVKDVIKSQFWAAGFQADLGGGYRIYAPVDNEAWLVTGPQVSGSGTLTINYPKAAETRHFKGIGNKISYRLDLARNSGNTLQVPVISEDVIPQFDATPTTEASFNFNGGISYNFVMPFPRTANPTLKMKFDTDLSIPDVIFADGASDLNYNTKTQVKLAYNDKFEWTLDLQDALSDGEPVTIQGYFKVPPSIDFTRFTASFDCDGWTADAKVVGQVEFSDVKVTEASNDLLAFNFKINPYELYQKFTNIPVLLWTRIGYGVDKSPEIRKSGQYLPECTADGFSISTTIGSSSSVHNTALTRLKITGTLADGTKSVRVFCKQQLNGGKKGAEKLTVTVTNILTGQSEVGDATATWDIISLVEPLNHYDRRVTVYADKVTSASALTNLIATTKTAIGSDSFVGDFRWVQSEVTQSHASTSVGVTPKFDRPRTPDLADSSSCFHFVYQSSNAADEQGRKFVKDGVQYAIFNIEGSSTRAVDSVAYVQGDDDASYAPLQVIRFGEGFSCWSSEQCQKFNPYDYQLYCFEKICTRYSQLSADAQTYLKTTSADGGDDVDDSDPASAMTASAAVAFVVLAVALFC